jgi:hypothetical protein
MLPVALPAVVGANFAVKEVFCPAASANGVDKPLMLKPGPVTLAAEIVRLAAPEFIRVIDTDPLAPTRRLPKLTLVGFDTRVP